LRGLLTYGGEVKDHVNSDKSSTYILLVIYANIGKLSSVGIRKRESS